MVKLTQSMRAFLWKFHRDIIHLVMLGHTEEVTVEIYDEYIKWLQTDEGRSYLRGGENYKE